ncbi:helix-turn-helix domain-containing protein [Falsibacillus pallidus]|uniref:Helix-turn-helix protein n=1 Tax=Falsibacillus pallidus TaxID=493781 RepID=A0A370GL23_9BACI|nr:helix-turn-helix domain-containing protein [Falsibacillus pallidus]RDI44060.1 helix-turn-helix protein [Falsibacillus pallidus]
MPFDYLLEKELGLAPKLEPKFANIDDDEMLTPNEVAVLIGLSSISVRRMCREGKIDSYQYNRKYAISGRSLKEFVFRSVKRTKSVREALSS